MIIDNWDPAGLLEMSCPADEYDSESAEVTRLALTPLGNKELGEKIFGHFTYMFGADVCVDIKECEDIAGQINEALKTEPREPVEESVIVIDADKIIDINKNGLLFRRDGGADGFIDFDLCRQNWIKYVIDSGEFSTVANDFKEKTRCVALRDITSLLFEFYSNPKVRIKIEPKHTFCYFKLNRINRYRKRFGRFKTQSMRQAGRLLI